MIKMLFAVATIGLFAVASSQAMAVEKTTIGNARIVVRTVTGTLESDLRQLQLQDDIYHNEIIETGDDSATEFVFFDETKLALGPNSKMVLDRFVFDPASDTGSFIMTATVGVFRFVSGKIPKRSYEIRTPNAVIGIRGTILSFIVIPGDTEDKPTKVNVTIEEGVAEITSCSGEQVSLSRPGASITVSMNSDGICTTSTPPVAQATEFTRMLAASGFESQ
jgi:hypothetical protein